ncbi:hypothetical protein [Bradyrhizobium oligotrophicum]|uniref:hypothetical protein n=1 Tax=Bradyrhizobium oligotrophicum TaxID=44255 RepID=UPI003EBFCFDA
MIRNATPAVAVSLAPGEGRHIFFADVLSALSVRHTPAAVCHHRIERDDVTLRMVRGAG